MRFFPLHAALAGTLALAACADRHDGDTAALEDQIFVSVALAPAQSQLAMAQLAELKAHTPSVVAYAQRVAAHSQPLSDQLAALARTSGTAGDMAHTPDAARFADLSGEAFERAYIASQIEDQQNALDDFAFAAGRQSDPALQKLAADAVPNFKQDLADAIEVVYDIPFQAQAEQDMGAGAVGRRR
jgi:putative membrane protein